MSLGYRFEAARHHTSHSRPERAQEDFGTCRTPKYEHQKLNDGYSCKTYELVVSPEAGTITTINYNYGHNGSSSAGPES